MFGLEFPGLSSQHCLPAPHPMHMPVTLLPPKGSDSLGMSKWPGLGGRVVDMRCHWWWFVNFWSCV